jgi:hypothetical protein
LNTSREAKAQSSCIFEVPVLTMTALVQGANLVSSQFEKIQNDWTEAQILSDLGKLNILYAFVSTFNQQMNAWKTLFNKCMIEYDILRGGNFPTTLWTHRAVTLP